MMNLFKAITVCVIVFSCAVLNAQEKTKFPLAISSKTLGYGILWAAQKQGFFDRQGLEVQLVVMRGADKAVQALVGGSVYVSASGADASIAAVEHGMDLVIVPGGATASDDNVELADRDAPGRLLVEVSRGIVRRQRTHRLAGWRRHAQQRDALRKLAAADGAGVISLKVLVVVLLTLHTHLTWLTIGGC